MSGADVLASGTVSRSAARGARPLEAARRLSRRTSLRTKLITAVLVLVAIAVAAISLASTYMVRAYLIDQHDGELLAQVSAVNFSSHLPQGVDVGYASPTRSDIVVGLQQPGSQLSWDTGHDPALHEQQRPAPAAADEQQLGQREQGRDAQPAGPVRPGHLARHGGTRQRQQRDHRHERPRPSSSSPWTSATSTR